MSGFMLVATAPRLPPAKKHGSAKVKSAKSSSSSVKSALTHTTTPNSKTDRSEETSRTGGAHPTRGDKQVFDPQTLTYVPFEETLSAYERIVYDYNSRKLLLKSKIQNHQTNERLNRDNLFSLESIHRLRFSYFESFEPNYDEVYRRLHMLPKPAYWAILWDNDAINTFRMFNKHAAESCVVEKLTVRDKVKEAEREQEIHNAEKQFEEKKSTRGLTVKDLLQKSSFWEEVYQDIKYESFAVSYHQWLPSRKVVQKFYLELLDHTLYNLHYLECLALENLAQDERDELKKFLFFYFNDADYSFMDMLARVHQESFVNLMSGWNSVRVEELMALVTEGICDNIKIHYYDRVGVEYMIKVWKDYLTCMVDMILMRQVNSRGRKASVASIQSLLVSGFGVQESNLLADLPILVASDLVLKAPVARKRGLFSRFRK